MAKNPPALKKKKLTQLKPTKNSANKKSRGKKTAQVISDPNPATSNDSEGSSGTEVAVSGSGRVGVADADVE